MVSKYEDVLKALDTVESFYSGKNTERSITVWRDEKGDGFYGDLICVENFFRSFRNYLIRNLEK